MLIDSHCHLDFPAFAGQEEQYVDLMRANGVDRALIAGVTLERFPAILALTERFPEFLASVGVHPDTEGDAREATLDELVSLARLPKVVAIGETGLDYYRLQGDLEWQRERFRVHINAAQQTGKPLIVHTRDAAADTLRLIREAGECSGVFHCFTETLEVAKAALDLGFMISFSGIVTFKNAFQIKEVAKYVPLDRLLVETDAPYLAPVPYRGKLNHPALVVHVAAELAALKGIPVDAVASATTANFYRLFKL